MSLVVGTYPVDPTDPEDSRRFYAALDRSGLYGALELPADAGGARTVPAAVPPGWSLVVTAIPGTMRQMAADPTFGLASTDEEGRRRALDFAGVLREDVARLTREGRRTLAVQLHSAPRGLGSGAALQRSLTELAAWDWSGAHLTVEHCDALLPDHAPEKGFLPLESEIEAVLRTAEATGVDVGITVNWARSVIETRRPQEAERHVRRAAEDGVLAGVMFSSCAPVATEFGYPWIDAHLPSREVAGAPPASLLTATHVRDCLAASGSPLYAGLKVDVRPRGLAPEELAARITTLARIIAVAAQVPAVADR